MQGFHVLKVGIAFAAMAVFPLLSTGSVPAVARASPDSTLEAACRASETTAPDSCPCTITRAREAGVSDGQMASLFEDDGHSRPIGEAIYSRFWKVKAQCVAASSIASLGIDPSTPLPPDALRGMGQPTPLPDNRVIGQRKPHPAALALRVKPGFRVDLPPYAKASPMRELSTAEFVLLRLNNAGCMAGIDQMPVSVREQNRENCRRTMALTARDFVATDIAVPAGYTAMTMLIPRAGGTACREGGCYWYSYSEDGSFSANYTWGTGSVSDMLEPFDP